MTEVGETARDLARYESASVRATPGGDVAVKPEETSELEGELITRFGAPLPGEAWDQFLWPHSIAVDSRGDVYVAEVSYTEVGGRLSPAREMVSLRKWRRAPN